MGWIDNINHWTDVGLKVAREIARTNGLTETRATEEVVKPYRVTSKGTQFKHCLFSVDRFVRSNVPPCLAAFHTGEAPPGEVGGWIGDVRPASITWKIICIFE